MGTASSVPSVYAPTAQAQAPVSKSLTKCELCKEDGILKWRCIQCESLICDICVAIHQKIPVLSKHNLVVVTDSRETKNDSISAIQSFEHTSVYVVNSLPLDSLVSFILNILVSKNDLCYIDTTWYIIRLSVDYQIVKTDEFSVQPFDMAFCKNGEIIFTENHEICILNQKSNFGKIITTVAPLSTRGICITPDNNILIGVVHEETLESKLLLFTRKGKYLKTYVVYKHDESDQRVIRNPYRIAIFKSGCIFLVNLFCMDSGCKKAFLMKDRDKITGQILSLGEGYNLKWIYSGNPSINSEKKLFTPSDIVITSLGYIAVSDFVSNAIHIIQENGNILTFLDGQMFGIFNPTSLDIDCEKRLWICCFAESVSDKQRIQILKLPI